MSPSAPEGLRVHGVGEAAGAPDVARTQLGVDVRAATAEQASAEATQRMAALTSSLKQLGIAEKDLRTSQYSLSFEPDRGAPPPPLPPSAPPPTAAGSKQPAAAPAAPAAPAPAQRGQYRVLNTLDVTIRDMALIGRVLQLAGDSDSTSAYGISYDLENDEALLTQARQRAVAEAQASAKELAKLTGVELGEVIAVTEEQPDADDDQPNTYALSSSGPNNAAPASIPVEEGEIKVHYGVQLVYAVRRR